MATDARLEQLWRDQWAGMPAWRGTLPRVPQRAELPTASKELAGSIVRVAGASGVADKVYVCQKGADDGYSWVQVDAGATDISALPKGVLGYTVLANTSSISINTKAVVATTPSVTVGTDRIVRVTAEVAVSTASSGTNIDLWLVDGSLTTSPVLSHQLLSYNAQLFVALFTVQAIATPSAGAHTYSLVAAAIGSAVPANTNNQTLILVEDIGAAT